jgi:phosphoglycerate dehydrogenase-like enzyme
MRSPPPSRRGVEQGGRDVYRREPVRDTSHPLLNMDNVICAPPHT